MNRWPSLPYAEWRDSCATLHLWTQVVGKVRLALTPPMNHWWHVPLYVGCRGLTTSAIPYGDRSFEIGFDFLDHRLVILCSDGAAESFPLAGHGVADFYETLMARLRRLGIEVAIRTLPTEIPDAVPFERDHRPPAYEADSAHRFWQVLRQSAHLLGVFRGRFLGKASPVHFFWGSFDLAATRFSGRTAPAHPGGVPNFPDWAAREAYSHECYSCGFWPGNGGFGQPAFYAYAYPEPAGFADAAVSVGGYDPGMREFVLPYEDWRRGSDPERALLSFLQQTYAAAADLGGWDRASLERP